MGNQWKEEHRATDDSCLVISGWHQQHGHVACKVLACPSDNTELLHSREVQILSTLSHSNICPVLSIAQTLLQGRHCVVITMPFVPTSLAKERHRRAKLVAHWQETELWSMLVQVVSALNYTIHSKFVIEI